jgi:hypothetical protein
MYRIGTLTTPSSVGAIGVAVGVGVGGGRVGMGVGVGVREGEAVGSSVACSVGDGVSLGCAEQAPMSKRAVRSAANGLARGMGWLSERPVAPGSEVVRQVP